MTALRFRQKDVAKNMVYETANEKIVFDDYADRTEEYDCCEVEMCPQCYNKYKNAIEERADDGGIAGGTCSVKGCNNQSDRYVDFWQDEVSFEQDTDRMFE